MRLVRIIIFILLSSNLSFACFGVAGCDATVRKAMTVQREVLVHRLDDLKLVMIANTKQTKNQTKIIKQEVLAYSRLLERIKLESMQLEKAKYLSKNIQKKRIIDAEASMIRK